MEKDTINIRMTLSDKLGEMEQVLNDILCDMDYNFEAEEEEYDDDVMVALGIVESAYHAVTLAKNNMQMAENFLSKSSTHYWDDADIIASRLNYIKDNVNRWSCDDAAKEQEW